jgi:hypothetical protein
MAAIPSAGAQAAIPVPCSAADLVAAIDTANGSPGADTLSLAEGCTYTLVAPDNGANGLPVISSDITIAGNGATITRASSAPSFRIFYVDSGGALTVNKVTISGGRAIDCPNSPFFLAACGGGIDNFGTLTMTQSRVTGNTATSSAAARVELEGGGIENWGTATVSQSAVSGNAVSYTGTASRSAAFGGGICNESSLQVSQTDFVGNEVSASGTGAGARGAAIANFDTAQVSRSAIANNSSSVSASSVPTTLSRVSGAVFSGGGATLAVTAADIHHNSVRGPQGNAAGGGIDSGGELTVASSNVHDNVVSANDAPDVDVDAAGGGIENRGTATVSRTALYGNTVNANDGAGFGGGFRNNPDGTSTLTRSSVTGNSVSGATASGGGVSNGNPAGGSLTLNRTTVSGNVPDDCDPPIGACT